MSCGCVIFKPYHLDRIASFLLLNLICNIACPFTNIHFPSWLADSLNLKLTFDFHFLSSGRPLYHMGLHLFQMHGLISELKLDILKVMKFLGEQFWPC